MLVKELKEELAKRGLNTSGLKADLEKRYKEAIAKEQAEKKGTGQELETNSNGATNDAIEQLEPAIKSSLTEENNLQSDSMDDEAGIEPDTKDVENNVSSGTHEKEEMDVEDGAKKDHESETKEASNHKSSFLDKEGGNYADKFAHRRSGEGDRSYRKRSRERSGDSRRIEDTKLYISNLSYKTTERDLRYDFERYGRILDVYLPRHYKTGDPRGFGFITFEDPRDAEDALEDMDGRNVDGRRITISFARSRPPPRRERSHSSVRHRSHSSRHQPHKEGRHERRSRSRSRSRGRD